DAHDSVRLSSVPHPSRYSDVAAARPVDSLHILDALQGAQFCCQSPPKLLRGWRIWAESKAIEAVQSCRRVIYTSRVEEQQAIPARAGVREHIGEDELEIAPVSHHPLIPLFVRDHVRADHGDHQANKD